MVEVCRCMTGAVGAVIFMAEIDAAVMGMRGTFSGSLASLVCISAYPATVVGIYGQVVGMLGTDSLASPRSVAGASYDVDGLTAITNLN